MSIETSVGATQATAPPPVRESVRAPRPRTWLTRRVAAWSLAGSAVALVLCAGVLRYRAAGMLRQRAIDAIHAACPTCALDVGRVELDVFRGRIRVYGVRFANAPADPLRIFVNAESAQVDLSWRSLRARRIRVTNVVLDGLQLTLQAPIRPGEGWAHPPPGPAGSPLRGMPPLQIDRVELHGGAFTYRETWPGRTVAIAFGNLEGILTNFATRAGMIARPTVALFTGVIAGSGRGQMRVETDLLARLPNARLDLSLRNQDLAAFRGYLVPTEGAHLSGHLRSATARMHLHDGVVRGQLEGSYEGVAVRFERTREHGGIETAMNNLGVAIEVVTTNSAEPTASRATPILRRMDPGEPLIGFLWNSLRDACMQLIMRDGRRS